MSDSCMVSGIIFRACRVWILYPEQRASSMQSFKVNAFRVSLSVGVHNSSSFKTVLHPMCWSALVKWVYFQELTLAFHQNTLSIWRPSEWVEKTAQCWTCRCYCAVWQNAASQRSEEIYSLWIGATCPWTFSTHQVILPLALSENIMGFPQSPFLSSKLNTLREQQGNLIPSDQCRKPPFWS